MPSIRAEKYGEDAWNDCKRYRRIAGFFVFILMVCMILWYWIPVPELNYTIYPDPLVPLLMGTILAIPFAILLTVALREAGRESFEPTQKTELFSGIYSYIRHPQLLGRTILTLALTMWLNSLFLLIFAGIFLGVLVPTLIHFEEMDLIKRFGDSYIQYRERTGSVIPKFRRQTK